MKFAKQDVIAILIGVACVISILAWLPSATDEASRDIAGMVGASPVATGSPDRHKAPAPRPTATPRPTPTPDRHDERVAYQDYWSKTTGNLAMVFACVNYAGKAAAQGDNVSASRILEYGQKFADNANHASLDPPNDWANDEIGSRLFAASNDLSGAMQKLRDYIDNGAPSSAAEAQDAATDAVASVDIATHAARISYVSMGGQASDLESMQSQVQTVVAGFDTLLNSANQ